MNNVLILTYESDPHADSVCDFFKKKNINFFKINTEHLIRDYKITFDSTSCCYLISDNKESVLLDETWNIWNRRILEPEIPNSIPKDLENIILTETERTWQGLLFSHKGKVVNKPQSNYNANNKIDQLSFVKDYNNNIKIPETILTNDPNVLNDFYNDHQSVCHKLLQVPMVIRNNEYFAVYTSIVSSEHIKHSDLIRNHPSLFQEYIDKEYELRITALKDKIIPIAIFSQSSEVSKVDFRRYDFDNVKYKKVDIPKNVEVFCKDMLKHYDLCFAEIDMIYDKNHDYYFLEINPNGQWLWLETNSGYNLTKDVAENIL